MRLAGAFTILREAHPILSYRIAANRINALVLSLWITLSATTNAQLLTPCVGDCNGDGCIEVSELVRGVNIALGELALTACVDFDSNADGRVMVNELVLGVRSALAKCRLREVAAGEAASGVIKSADDSYGILRFGPLRAPASAAGSLRSPMVSPTISDVAVLSGIEYPCSLGGTLAVECHAEGMNTRLTLTYENCVRAIDASSQLLIDGIVENTIESLDRRICELGSPLPGSRVTELTVAFTQTITNSRTGEVFASTMDLVTNYTFSGGGSCLERNGTNQLNGRISSSCQPGSAASGCPQEGTSLEILVVNLTLDIQNQLAGLEDDRCIEVSRANGDMKTRDLISGRSNTARYTDYLIIRDEGDGSGGFTRSVMNGEIQTECFGKAIVDTMEALVRDPAMRCPRSGILEVEQRDGTVLIDYANGGVFLDFLRADLPDAYFPDCEDPNLRQCPETQVRDID